MITKRINVMNMYNEFDDIGLVRVGKAELTETNMNLPTERHGAKTNADKVTEAVCDNFERILDISQSMVDIRRMKVQSEAVLKVMAEKRETLKAEAEAYAQKRNADTKSVVDRMNIVRLMMKDFYDANTGTMTSEDFRIVITEIVSKMGTM